MRALHPLRQLNRWHQTLQLRLPGFSYTQGRTLALWSFAAMATQHIGSTTCAHFLAELFGKSSGSMRERLRTFYRRSWQAEAFFAALFSWCVRLQAASAAAAPRVVLALDATLIRDRFSVLAISFLFRGSAIPVAWAVLPANEPGAWLPLCKRLLTRLAESPQAHAFPVVVTADRGLQSRVLFEHIVALGWHPVMRLVRGGLWQAESETSWQPVASVVAAPRERYAASGRLFKTEPLACTLVGLWAEEAEEPWLLMTDLPASEAVALTRGALYGLRAWIEQGFRCLKSGAQQCHRVRMQQPERVARQWLVLSLTLLWTHSVGSSARLVGVGEPVVGRARRELSVHRMGWLRLLARLIRGESLPQPRQLRAEARPCFPAPPS